jgi:two-component system, chemotaxis family, protein-glutamate methylesterase/glutaminase
MAARRGRARARPAPVARAREPARRDIVVIGTSAGGIDAIRMLLAGLPADLPAAVFVVVHIDAKSPGLLPRIFGRAGRLPVEHARDGAPVRPGRVYVAPPDRHVLLEADGMRVVRGPTENRHRPAIDPLFRSAAWAFGPRVIGVVLTGLLDDGAAGLWAVKTCGGLAVVQDPADAAFPDMPRNALAHVRADRTLPLAAIAPALVELTATPASAAPAAVPERVEIETRFAKADAAMPEMDALGQPSTFACPACHGALWELQEGTLRRYRCHTGHAFGPESLAAALDDETERALTESLRALHEQGRLLRRLAERYPNTPELAERNLERARDVDRSAETIRRLLAPPRGRRQA